VGEETHIEEEEHLDQTGGKRGTVVTEMLLKLRPEVQSSSLGGWGEGLRKDSLSGRGTVHVKSQRNGRET
jgi:hypothetical protein